MDLDWLLIRCLSLRWGPRLGLLSLPFEEVVADAPSKGRL